MPGRPLIHIDDSNGDVQVALIFVFIVFAICMFMGTIWSMFHFQRPGRPDTRTWEQKHKDKAFNDCQYNTSDPTKIEKCYITIYGVPAPDYQPAIGR